VSPFRLYGEKLEKITVQEAGRRGGLSVLANRGREHFVAIGKKGQEALRERYPNMAKEWGKRGGRPRKHNLE
jgi:general stress protein YciG